MKLSGPNDPLDYIKYTLDEIEVYIAKDVETEDFITIKEAEYFSDLPNKEFEVEGVR